MTRDEGFAVMDVSTSLLQDPKVRRLQRHAPDRWPVAMIAYVSTMSESWKAGRRVSVEDAWPVGLPYDPLAAEGLSQVGLVDANGLIVPRTWRSWFGNAKSRRAKTRADWRKWQAEHRKSKGGVSPDSAPDKGKPSAPSVRPSDLSGASVPPVDARENDGLQRAPTKEEILFSLSERYQNHELSQVDYERERRKVLAS
jgi:hypothetical protein